MSQFSKHRAPRPTAIGFESVRMTKEEIFKAILDIFCTISQYKSRIGVLALTCQPAIAHGAGWNRLWGTGLLIRETLLFTSYLGGQRELSLISLNSER
jgi:hypothetical protein